METVLEEIKRLKAERNAVILAHNYVNPEIQDIADFLGDSLELSFRAKESGAEVIVFCGVRFMAETAKLLSPKSTVLIPIPDAGCAMADMVNANMIKAYKKDHPDAMFVAYVNTTAETKAEVDLCCTSGNVEKVLKSIPENQEVMFLPDRNLGGNMNRKMNRNMDLWKGYCPVHDAVTPEMIRQARAEHPGARVLVHPECKPEVVAECDYALSTAGILKKVKELDAKEFIIGTEKGIFHRIQKENPEKKFYSLNPDLICPDMKKITLESVRDALKNMSPAIELPSDMMDSAVKPILKMMEL
ncbi:MAG: quinolinate synthase NadA [Lentisphaeria bacterium]|nr:quinolinate synthase NadA [Lentisphaeria bacterium]